jgi:hypothetical protein
MSYYFELIHFFSKYAIWYQLRSTIQYIPGQRLKNRRENRISIQWLGSILGHKSQFKMTVICFHLLSDTKKTMFYVWHSKPKLDYTDYIEISLVFSKIESHDVPYLNWVLVCDILSSCIVDRRVSASNYGKK